MMKKLPSTQIGAMKAEVLDEQNAAEIAAGLMAQCGEDMRKLMSSAIKRLRKRVSIDQISRMHPTHALELFGAELYVEGFITRELAGK